MRNAPIAGDNFKTLTAADIRAAMARAQVMAFLVAARLRIHPVTLSRRLHGRLPLDQDFARRIITAIEAEEAASREHVVAAR